MKADDRIVSGRTLFTSCRWILTDFLQRLGVVVEFVDAIDRSAWEAALARPATLVLAELAESPTNPTMEVINIAAVAKLAHAAGAGGNVNSVFATPLLQHLFELGADLVVYSATTHIATARGDVSSARSSVTTRNGPSRPTASSSATHRARRSPPSTPGPC